MRFLLLSLALPLLATNNGYSPTFTGVGNGCIAGGTCFYIDFVGGSDSNNGTSKVTAWKSAPGMACATGTPASHTVSQVDEYIFKGGVTWTASCFPWLMTGGNVGTPNTWAYPGIYIGYDPTWNAGIVNSVRVTDPGSCASGTTLSVGFSGGGGSSAAATAQVETDPYAAGDLEFVTMTNAGSGYTSNPTVAFSVTGGSCSKPPTAYADILSPVMNGSGTVYGSSSTIPIMLQINSSYAILDHIEFEHYLWYAGGTYSGGSPNMIGPFESHQVVQNLFVHDFGMNGAAVAANLVGARNAAQTCAICGDGAVNNNVINNYEREAAGGCDNGYSGSCTQNTAIYGDPVMTNNVIACWRAGIYTTASLTAGWLVAGNKMWAILSDPASQHPDAFYLLGGTVAYNNILRDIYNGTAAFYVETSDGSTPTAKGMTSYLFNNVAFGIGTNGVGTSTPPIGWSSEFVASGANAYSPAPDLRAYNNTFYSNAGNTACINAGQWFGASQTLTANYPFVLQNNMCVSTQVAGHWYDSNGVSAPCCGTWNGLTDPSNSTTRAAIDPVNVIITPTNSTSQGYTAGNNFAPTVGTNDTVTFASGGNSINLTSLCSSSSGGVSLSPLCQDINGNARPVSGGWQAGAFNLVAGGSSSPGAFKMLGASKE